MSAPPAIRRVTSAMAKRPAFPLLLLFVAGILSHPLLPPKPLGEIAAVGALLAVALWRLRDDLLCTLCLAAAILLLGSASAQLALLFYPADNIGLFTDNTDRLANLQMRMLDTPRLNSSATESHWVPPKQLALAEVTAVETLSGWRAASGEITVTLDPPLDQLAAGQTIRALGFLSRPHPPDNPGQFDFAAYDRKQGVLAAFRVRRSDNVQIIADSGVPLLVRMRQSARRLLAEGFPPERRVDSTFLRLLLFGDADPRLNFIRDEFDVSGTAYQLSISGLHLAILSGFLLLIFRVARLAPERALWITLLLVGLYASVALPSQSGWRSLMAFAITAAGILGGRLTDGLQIFATAVLTILILAPADLYSPGLQIGAAAVLSLILFARPIWIFLSAFGQSEVIHPGPPPENPPLKAAGLFALRVATGTILASAIIWVWVLPLVAYHFQQASPWTVPGGVLLLPLTVAGLLSGVAKIFLTLICPWLAASWATMAGFFAALLREGVDRLAHLPASGVAMSAPPAWVFVIYYGVLLLPLVPWRRQSVQWIARLLWIPACAALLALSPSAIAQAIFPATPGGVRVTFLSIGTGQTALIRVAGGRTFFLDCGSGTDPEVYAQAIQPYLLHEDVRRVDGLFLTTAASGRINGAAEIIGKYKPPMVYLTPQFRRRAENNSTAQQLMSLLDNHGPAPSVLAAGEQLNLGPGATLQILWPPRDCAMSANNCGMVARLTCAGHSILFPADIETPAITALLKHPEALKSDVLVAPHGGSAETGMAAFLRAVHPQYIICSSGESLTRKEEAFDQLARAWPIYRTDQCGAIDVTFGADGKVAVGTFRH